MCDEYFSVDKDCERLSCTSQYAAVQEWYDDLPDVDGVPEEVTVWRFTRVKADTRLLALNALDRLLERLDEDYGDPEGDYTESDDAMKKAAAEFGEKVVAQYKVWMCERDGSEVVSVKECLA